MSNNLRKIGKNKIKMEIIFQRIRMGRKWVKSEKINEM